MPRPEDRFSRTVEDAAAYERWRAQDDYLEREEFLDHREPDEEWDDDPDPEDYDPCNCSDPTCPCGGRKQGLP